MKYLAIAALMMAGVARAQTPKVYSIQTHTEQAGTVSICRGVNETYHCDPMVVPALEESYGPFGFTYCDSTCTFVIDGDGSKSTKGLFGVESKQRTHMTCADKRRVFLTTEDGDSFCVLFPDDKGGK